jgi:DNA-binding MarR family transcriptional regulator
MDASAGPLNTEEERAWRDLSRVIIVTPRVMDADLQREANISLSAYTVLVHLSEAAAEHLRVSELADLAYLSGSRVTRLVDELARAGLVVKSRNAEDSRGVDVRISDAGLARLKDAYPVHLASVRARVMDHVNPKSLPSFRRALAAIVVGLEETPPPVRPVPSSGRR